MPTLRSKSRSSVTNNNSGHIKENGFSVSKHVDNGLNKTDEIKKQNTSRQIRKRKIVVTNSDSEVDNDDSDYEAEDKQSDEESEKVHNLDNDTNHRNTPSRRSSTKNTYESSSKLCEIDNKSDGESDDDDDNDKNGTDSRFGTSNNGANIGEEIEEICDLTTATNTFDTFAQKSLFDVSDRYFIAQSSKSKVSKNSFSTVLNNFNLNEQEINNIIQNDQKILHQELNISKFSGRDFLKFYHLLRSDFNILLYGYGSKRNILNEFADSYLRSKHHFIVFNGYSQEITLKHVMFVLNKSINNHLESPTYKDSELFELLKNFYDQSELYLVIHSADILFTKNVKIRNLLTNLFLNVPNVRLVASVDHINSPLLWSLSESSTFRWIWFHIATFEPYSIEKRFSTGISMISSNSKSWKQSITFSSVKHVYQSLNSNAQKIFVLILKQFINSTKVDSVGFPFTELYNTCREEFLVNSETTLRAQMSEFKDHNLLKFKKGPDGSDTIVVCVEKLVAKKFIDEIEAEN